MMDDIPHSGFVVEELHIAWSNKPLGDGDEYWVIVDMYGCAFTGRNETVKALDFL